MGRNDWAYVNLPKLLVKRLDSFVQSQKARETGIYNKSELLRKIVNEFLEEQEHLYNNIESIPEFIEKMSNRDHIVLTHNNDAEFLEILNAFFERGEKENSVCVLAILKEEEEHIVKLTKKCDLNVDTMFNDQDAVICFVDECIKEKFDITPFKNDMEWIQESAKRRKKNGIMVLATTSETLSKQKRFSDVLLDEKYAHDMAATSDLPLSIICLYTTIPNNLMIEIEKLHDVVIKRMVTKTGLQ